MEEKFKKLKSEFDAYIEEIKDSQVYTNYINSKANLQNCSKANDIVKTIKELQQIKMQYKSNNISDIISNIENDIETLYQQYDLLFEVIHFNKAYDELSLVVNQIKYKLENMMI
ncbi:MAG: YlbF family regulator [Bacilli bacterium]